MKNQMEAEFYSLFFCGQQKKKKSVHLAHQLRSRGLPGKQGGVPSALLGNASTSHSAPPSVSTSQSVPDFQGNAEIIQIDEV